MIHKMRILSLSLILVLATVLSGCNSNQPDPNGGTVTLSMFSAFKGLFNPLFAEDKYDTFIIGKSWDSMWGYDDKLNITTDNYLGDKYEFSEDKQSITISMKQNIKWHDGQTMKIDDIICAWESLADPKYDGPRFSNVDMIKGATEKKEGKSKNLAGVKKVDDYTVTVELTEPRSNLLSTLWSTPIPSHIFGGVPVSEMKNMEASKTKVVGNGPFKITEVKPNEYVLFERFDDYYRGPAKVGKIVFKVLNHEVAVGALKKGELDFMTMVAPKELEELSKDSNVVTKKQPDYAYQYLGFNLDNPKLQNKQLRQAITYAIDRPAIVSGLLKNEGYLTNQHIPKNSWAYNKNLENAYQYSVEKAKSLLAEAGYKDVDGDGFVEDPNGKKFSLTLDYPTGNPVREKVAPIIAENLKLAGIKVDVQQPREMTSHFDNVKQGKVEMFLAGWSLTPDPDPIGIFMKADPLNMIRYDNPESEKLLRDAVTSLESFDQNKRKEIYAKWTELISEDAPQVFLYGENMIESWNPRVKDVDFGWQGAVEGPNVIKWSVQ